MLMLNGAKRWKQCTDKTFAFLICNAMQRYESLLAKSFYSALEVGVALHW